MTSGLRQWRRARLVRRRALEYTFHGWPLAPLAVPTGGACPCGAECEDAHVVGRVTRSPAEAEKVWADGCGWDIALTAGDFDIVELPPAYGSELNRRLVTACPTMTVWRGRRWYFIVESGCFPADRVEAVGGIIHAGSDAWVAAPPTRSAPYGRRYWVVDPFHTRWRPYRRVDAIEAILGAVKGAGVDRGVDRE